MTLASAPLPAAAVVRELVLREGYNATAYQILNPGMRYWMAPGGGAVAGYVRRGRTWVVAGVPVTAATGLSAAVAALEAQADDDGCAVCFFGAGERLAGLVRGDGRHSAIVIGAQPAWDPRRWSDKVASHRSVREQLRRARCKEVRIAREPDSTGIRHDPQLRACLERWLATRPMPPLRFLTEPGVLGGELRDRRVYVARAGTAVVGFLVASPVPARGGWLFEQIVRDPDAPNGSAELLIDRAMRDLADERCPWATLGLVALCDLAPLRQNPRWLRCLFAWARAHGRRFYRFDGLQQFRAKLRPDDWEPLYAIANRPRFSPRLLANMGAAFCEGSLAGHLTRSLARAAARETRWAAAALLATTGAFRAIAGSLRESMH